MHTVDLDTGVWISDHDEQFIVYVHEAEIVNGSFNITWEWLSLPHQQAKLSKMVNEIHHSFGVSIWPYHRPAMRINEEETP